MRKLHEPNTDATQSLVLWVSFLPTFQTLQWRQSRHKLQSTDNFIDAIKTVQMPDDHKLVFFEVKSLFTSIPLQLALDCAKTAINKSPYQPLLPTDDLMGLLHLCLNLNLLSVQR